MSNVTFYISNLLEKMTSTDKDFRFMAANDLMMELQKDSIKLDEESERKVVAMLLKLLEDKNGEVQNLAVKWLSTALVSFHQSILTSLLAQLTSPHMAVRKRSIIALGHLVPSCSPALFMQLTEHLMGELSRGPPTASVRTYIQCLATVSRRGGHRIGEHLQKIVPMVVKFCNVEDDELREFCFQAFEAFVSRCPKEMSPNIQAIIKLCLKYITYDPNYNYDDREDEDQESDDEYSDDDDMSWKVRRSSVKCLEAIISSRRDLLVELYGSVGPTLVSRFKEREDNVKTDIFSAFVALLRQTRHPHGPTLDTGAKEEPAISLLKKQVPTIVKALHRQLKEKSMRCRQSCFSLLTEMTNVLPGQLGEHIPALIPGIIYSLTDKSTSSNLKIDALAFLNVLLSSHNPEIFHPHISVILPPVIQCVEDPFYKITSEALQVTQQTVKLMRPLDKPVSFDGKPYVKIVFACTLKRLKAADIDQEVKERAIFCMGHILSHFGDQLGADLQPTLQIFLERLKNEITRLVAVKTLSLVASSPLKIDLRPILTEGIPMLGSFLRKNQRALKLNTITALNVMVTNYSDSFKPPLIDSILSEVPALIQESDMHISQVAITLITCMAKVCPSSLSKIGGTILPEVLNLVHSPLLQGGALNSLLEFFQVLVATKANNMGYSDLLKALRGPFYDSKSTDSMSMHKQSYYSVAKCVAALSMACPKEASGVVTNLIQDVKNPKSSESVRILSLLCLGEIGRFMNFEGQKELKGVIMEAFGSPNEEVKSAASFALGNICVANLGEYLPFMLKEIGSQPKRQYLLLHSLKEMISALSAESLKPHVENIWDLLFKHCECAEEGTRNIVAECLGKLTLVSPSELIPRLKKQLCSGSPLSRSTVVTAVKFTIVDHPMPIDSLLKGCIAAHNKPSLIRGLLTSLLPHLYKETQIRKDLVREVEMGPFKHTVDDGLDVRKAAFECMYTLLDSCMDCLDIFEFLNHVEEGLKDHYDIKMLTFIMLARLSKLCPSAVVQRLDRLVEPLKATCTTKVKAGSVKQEFEKQEELRRSAMRAVAALLSISEVEKSPAMADFANQIRSNTEMATIFDSLQGDPLSGAVESMDTS
uniref:Cullin-associated and neddylation-dissociated 2 (putative) n=1 Tax=Cyprinus carpio carpio TaxID=630221 RepID=A0A9J8CVB2_CYPCA